MFKDFTTLNGVARKAIPPVLSNQLSRGLSLQSGILQRIRDLANEYTSAYNSVSVIKYDESGEPIDVTPSEKMSVPENRLAVVKAWVSDARDRLRVIRDLVSQSSTSSRTVTADVADPETMRYNIAGHLLKRSEFGGSLPKNLYGLIPSGGLHYAAVQFNDGGDWFDCTSAFIGVTFPDVWKAEGTNYGKALAYWRNDDSSSGVVAKTTASGAGVGDLVVVIFIDHHKLAYQVSKSTLKATPLSSLSIPLVSDTIYTDSEFTSLFEAEADTTGLSDVSSRVIAIEPNNSVSVSFSLTPAAKGFTADSISVSIDQLNVDEILIPDADLASLESAI